MLLLHLYNDIPQLNLGLFLLRSADTTQADPERMRLSGTQGHTPKYTQVGNLRGQGWGVFAAGREGIGIASAAVVFLLPRINAYLHQHNYILEYRHARIQL